jgi:hypothetical protein
MGASLVSRIQKSTRNIMTKFHAKKNMKLQLKEHNTDKNESMQITKLNKKFIDVWMFSLIVLIASGKFSS